MNTLVEDGYLLLSMVQNSISVLVLPSIMMMEPKPEGDVVIIEVITYRITLVP